MAQADSIELMRRVRLGDERAATELFDRYVERLQAVVRRRLSGRLRRRCDPDDVVQSAYRSFFHHVRDGRFELRECGDLWRLLAAIAVNKVRGQAKRHRAAKRSIDAEQSHAAPDSLLGLPLEAVANDPSPVEANVLVEQLQAALSGLSTDYRQIIELRLQGRTTLEIAQTTGCSERTVHRARERFKELLTAQLAEHSTA